MLRRGLFSGTPLRKLGGEAAVAAGTTLFGKCIGFSKELFVAAAFGLSGDIDVYLVAMVLVGFPMTILLNATQSAMIAKLAAVAEDALPDRAAVFARVVLLTTAALAVLLVAWLAVMPSLLPTFASGFTEARLEQLSAAISWLIPYYFLSGINLLGYGYLQVMRKYTANGMVPVLTPIAVLLIVSIGQHHAEPLHLLTGSIVVGAILETAALALMLKQVGIGWEGARGLTATGKTIVRHIASGSVYLLPGTAVMALGPLVDQSLAATLGEGSNAALAYGNKLPAAVQSVLISAVAITVLPFFSSQLAKQAHDYCLTSLKRLALVFSVGGTLLAAPLIIASRHLVEGLYQRGQFSPQDVLSVYPIQSIYLAQIPFALVTILCLKAVVAQNRHLLISAVTCIAVALQVTLGYYLKSQYGPAGIAIANTATSAVTAGLYFAFAMQGMRRALERVID